MATTTPNIGLTLPAGTELRSRAVWNANFTILDTKIGAVGNTSLQSQINTLSSQLTTHCRQIQLSLSVNAGANAITQLLNSEDFTTSTLTDTLSGQTLANLFGGKTIDGVVAIYGSGVLVIFDNQVSLGKNVSIRVYNMGGATSGFVLRMLVFSH